MKLHRFLNVRYALISAALLVMAVLLFARLGHYALWDDETMVALVAQGVMKTGDTSVRLDHGNIAAYRNGDLTRDFCDRSTPPLATYLTAISFTLFGINAWAARLPFAIFGLATFALILFWARHQSWPVLLVLIAGLLGNVSLILYFRQCRYYAPIIFFSVAIVYVYWRWKPTPRSLLTLAGLSILLFVSNYMSYLALYICLAVDYSIWKRKDWQLSWTKALLLFGPQLLINGVIACIWNPFLTAFGTSTTKNSLGDRLTLFLWYFRDLSHCEFFALPILLLALVIGLMQKQNWLVRGCVALLVYITVIVIVSPQSVANTDHADVRYVTPLIPLVVALETGALCIFFKSRTILLVGAALIVFGTNLLNGGPFLKSGFRSTILSYTGELLYPVPEAYTPTAQWINGHVPEGDSIRVLPNYSIYPLMILAPKALYAWQLDWPPRPDFKSLPLIHFKEQEPPDYLIVFGPYLDNMVQDIKNGNYQEAKYVPVATLNVFWFPLYRPELFRHAFQPITNFDPSTMAVYIFQRTNPPIPVKKTPPGTSSINFQ